MTDTAEITPGSLEPGARAPRSVVGAGTVAGVGTLGILAVGLPSSLLVGVADSGRSDAWVVTFGVLVWAGGRLAWLVSRARPRLFDFFFWLFTYIFLGLAPTVQLRSGQLSQTTPGMDPDLDLPAASLVVVGLACYELGRGVALRRELLRAATPAVEPNARTTAGAPVSELRTAILFLAGAVTATYYLAVIGLPASREEAAAAKEVAFSDPTVRVLISAAALYPVLFSAGALALLRPRASTPGRRRLIVLCLAVSLLLVLAAAYPPGTARYVVGTAGFAIAVFLGALATRSRVRTTMAATLLGFLFVFPIADAFRREGGGQVRRPGFFGEYRYNADYDGFWQIANAYAYWQDGLVEPLRQATGSLLFWVPRSIWAGKPADSGEVLADYRGYTFDNLSAPLWAEALVNGGLVLLVIGFLALGWGLRRLDTRIVREFDRPGPWLIVAAVFPVFTTILLRGSLLQATGALAISIACVVFVSPSPGRAGGVLRER